MKQQIRCVANLSITCPACGSEVGAYAEDTGYSYMNDIRIFFECENISCRAQWNADGIPRESY